MASHLSDFDYVCIVPEHILSHGIMLHELVREHLIADYHTPAKKCLIEVANATANLF